jgi:antitoxin (DNA-binding transcriptional repressor) of toxin-antitoxin stability system
MKSALDTREGYRVVTARTLARNMSKLLREMQECPGLLVTRHGIPIAVVTPIERSPSRRASGVETVGAEEESDVAEAKRVVTDLEPIDKDVLGSLVTPLNPESVAAEIGRPGMDLMMMLTGLELKGLVRREFPGIYRLTNAGRVLLALIDLSRRGA